MARNGSGTYSLPAGNPVVTGTTISSTWANNTLSDIATALTNSIAKDGQTTPTANMPMGNFKFTGLGAGSASTDSVTLGQAQAQAFVYLSAVAGSDTITASSSPATAAYVAGQTFRFVAASNNTGAVTLNINSLGAKSVTKNGTSALVGGDILSGGVYQVTYDGTQFQIMGATAPHPDTVAIVRGSSDATKLVRFEADGITTATTRVLTVQDKDLTIAGLADLPVPTVRQTIYAGPVDSNGLPNFGGSTGSGTVTASGTLYASAANQTDNRFGSIANPSWTGLTTNGTMYLYLTVNADGTCTTGSTTLAPTYQWGGTYSTTNNQHTFNIQEMTMKVGNGSAASQTYRVFVGQVTVAGSVVTAITWYALMGRYLAPLGTAYPAATSRASFNHNIGAPCEAHHRFQCVTTDVGYAVGDIVNDYHIHGATGTIAIAGSHDNLTVGFINNIGTVTTENKTTGVNGNVTRANWNYVPFVKRVF